MYAIMCDSCKKTMKEKAYKTIIVPSIVCRKDSEGRTFVLGTEAKAYHICEECLKEERIVLV